MNSNVVSADALAAWLILQLAEQGRFEEVIAQMVSSYIVAADGSGDELYDLRTKITKRVMDLIMDPSEIWDGLLPGGPGSSLPMDFNIVSTGEWAKLHDKARILEQVEQAFRQNYVVNPYDENGDNDARLEAIGRILKGESAEDNRYSYAVSIIINPTVRHDELTDLMSEAQTINAESPLNLAKHVIDRIDEIDESGNWPGEELAAWITHKYDGEDFIMTWDQARAIIVLDETKEKLDRIGFETGGDWDDQFQGIADQMVMQGREYVAGRFEHEL